MRPFPPSLSERLADRGRELRILVLRFGAMGDIVRTLPMVRQVRAALPGAKVMWAVDEPWHVLLHGHAAVDEIVAAPRSRWKTELKRVWRWPRLAAEVARWSSRLRELDAGLALDFHGNLRSGVAGWLSRAPVTLGYAGHQQREGNALFTTHRVSAGPRRISRVERNLELLRPLGVPRDPVPDAGFVFDTGLLERAREIARAAVGGHASYAVLSPGASRSQAYKRPPVGLLASAVRVLARFEIATLVVYGPGEEPDARRIVEAEPDAAHLAPPTDLRLLGALLRLARLFVGGDTGPMHLACGVGCPVVAIYAPTDPVVNGPWGVPHRAVYPPDAVYTGIKRVDRERFRFEDIPPGAVELAVRDLMTAERSGPHDP